MPTPYEVERYRPLKLRRRVLVLLLALATAGVVMWGVLGKPGGAALGEAERKARGGVAADAPRCAPGQSTGCVGGTATVIVAPAASAASLVR
jgi:hypothetical protein